MNIVEIVGLNGPEGAENSKTEMKFSQNADFQLEILPSIFKASEFAGAGIVWIDPEAVYLKVSGTECEEKRVKVPIRVCSSGFSRSIAESIRYAISDDGIVITVSGGERYRVSLKTNVRAASSEDDGDSASNESKSESKPFSSTFRATPVKAFRQDKPPYVFADVPDSDRPETMRLSVHL